MLTLILSVLALTPAHADQPPAPSFTVDQVIERMTVELKDVCDFDEDSVKDRKGNAQAYAFKAKDYDTIRDYQLFDMPCTRGAYNFGSVYYLADAYGSLRHLAFAQPSLNEKDIVDGWDTEDTLINSQFEPKDLTLSFFSKHRGLGDCFSSGFYKFVNGRFLLKNFTWDGKCDGKIRPKKIVDLK